MMKTLIASLGILTLSVTAWAAPPKKTPEMLKKGQEVFKLNCVACHGEKGLGDGPAAVALDPKPRSFAKDKFKNGETPAQVFKTISEGITGTPMVAYGHLPEADRWALVYHVLSYRQPKKDKK